MDIDKFYASMIFVACYAIAMAILIYHGKP